MNKKRKKIPFGGRRRDMSSTNDQHIEILDSALKTFRYFSIFQLRELLILPAIISIGKFFNMNTLFLIFIIFPLVILFSLRITTRILIEYENLKIIFKNIIHR